MQKQVFIYGFILLFLATVPYAEATDTDNHVNLLMQKKIQDLYEHLDEINTLEKAGLEKKYVQGLRHAMELKLKELQGKQNK